MFMTDLQYSELFDFLSQRFDRLESRIINLEEGQNNTQKQIKGLQNTQDSMLGELKVLTDDKTVGAYRSGRMESWIKKAAKKINLPYNP
jgi:hypothetical protein